MDIEKKDAVRNFRSEGLKRGRTGGSRRAKRASKRGSRVRVARMLKRDESSLTT